MPEQVAVIRWEEPPPGRLWPRRRKPSSRYAGLAEQLRANPGRWGVVWEGRVGSGTALASHIRMGHMLCFTPAGDFDATFRQSAGQAVVYARYVGDGES